MNHTTFKGDMYMFFAIWIVTLLMVGVIAHELIRPYINEGSE